MNPEISLDRVVRSTIAELCVNALRTSPARLYAAKYLLRTADRMKARGGCIEVLRIAVALASEVDHG